MSDVPSTRSMARRWRLPLGLFIATVISVFMQGAMFEGRDSYLDAFVHLADGWAFAVPLLAILVTHELGHYVAAMLHRVPASLPLFIPLPFVSAFGTMGAVIDLPDQRLPSRNALIDIGASGPLAGMAVAVPVLIVGLMSSEVRPVTSPAWLEGNSLFYLAMKAWVVGPIPEGQDVFLHPTAFAGWAGLLVTMLNLFPVAQLDGGHIALALFGKRQATIDKVLLALLPVVFAYNAVRFESWQPGLVWIVWFGLLLLITRYGQERELPPAEQDRPSAGRRVVAVLCLVLFVALFMPTPMRAV